MRLDIVQLPQPVHGVLADSLVTAGTGHIQAARAVEAASKTMRPDDQVESVDVLSFGEKLLLITVGNVSVIP